MTPTCSNSPEWRRVHSLEDYQALLNECRDHARVLYAQGWHQGSWDAVYDEAVAIKYKLNLLYDELARIWPILHAAATGDEP